MAVTQKNPVSKNKKTTKNCPYGMDEPQADTNYLQQNSKPGNMDLKVTVSSSSPGP